MCGQAGTHAFYPKGIFSYFETRSPRLTLPFTGRPFHFYVMPAFDVQCKGVP